MLHLPAGFLRSSDHKGRLKGIPSVFLHKDRFKACLHKQCENLLKILLKDRCKKRQGKRRAERYPRYRSSLRTDLSKSLFSLSGSP